MTTHYTVILNRNLELSESELVAFDGLLTRSLNGLDFTDEDWVYEKGDGVLGFAHRQGDRLIVIPIGSILLMDSWEE